jgi:argininosuccinate synthase
MRSRVSHGVWPHRHDRKPPGGHQIARNLRSPGLLLLIAAHRDLESLTLTADVTQYKRGIEETYSRLVYNGLWYSPLKLALDAFIQQTQERVSGTVRVKLFKGTNRVVGRQSDLALYSDALATYSS